ncbi:P87/VP80 [Chrysodeixis chalcites nucleopolyhedrovirus]|uniref:p87/VP80 n=1 Tax=Chrysodeixis chalcites nucleopolyhedrovirus TaxID=320432 RepID=Q4KSY3_9ABAC|nr:P87/VP80 [Chrysodeixis chalcites nucleopolyhedrovirus]AAY84028.1 P87/VP80 [Chrysodeixis chalcites nucleopolyhedrovirus]AGC36311.1 P87/VP80 protein [Chrysodeixis chalcites SNPV TF1-A]AGE61504.1 P87/VP80 protein [Chrysodeixis chalcites nucleopolyhedrovirus]AGE61657.1 P87/VP80 protein [Chrysodeixis chalcites nucleopolyhedrovirus]
MASDDDYDEGVDINTADATIRHNTFKIKFEFANLLFKYLAYVRPEERINLESFRSRLDDLDIGIEFEISNFTLDNVINQMKNLLIYVTPGPSVNVEPSATSVTTANLIFTNNDDIDTIKLYLTNLLQNENLKPLTYRSLNELDQRLKTESIIYADILSELRLDAIDCEQNTILQRFLNIYKNYGIANCIDTDLRYYVEKLRDFDRSTLPPTVADALKTIIYNMDSPYKIQVTMDRQEYLTGATNVDVRALFNRYNEILPIKFVSSETSAVTPMDATTSASFKRKLGSDRKNYSSSSEYDDDTDAIGGVGRIISDIGSTAADSSTLRKKRRKRKAKKISSASTSKPIATTKPSTTTTTEPIISSSANQIFIEGVRQSARPTMALPPLLLYIIRIVPTDVNASLLTCPSNALSSNINTFNFYGKLSRIKSLNLTTVDRNVHFFELLEPLAHYGVTLNDINRSIWFISKAGNYFEANAFNFNNIRRNLAKETDDSDRIALFMIRYNFLWHYRQFISKLVSSAISPYKNQKIVNVLQVCSNSVNRAFDKANIRLNNSKIYSGPVDDIVRLMNGMFADLLI